MVRVRVEEKTWELQVEEGSGMGREGGRLAWWQKRAFRWWCERCGREKKMERCGGSGQGRGKTF